MRDFPAAGTPLGDAYRTAIAAALDAGLHYNVDVEAYVRARLGDAETAEAHELPCERLAVADDGLPALRARRQALIAELAARPRGTWRAVAQVNEDGRVYWTAAIATGHGRPYSRDDGWAGKPTYAELLERLQASEIYDIRNEIEAARERAKNVAAIAAHGLAPGRRFAGTFRLGGQVFTSAEILEVNPAPDPHVTIIGVDARGEGFLKLRLTKRGSRRRWTASLGAAGFAAQLPAAPPAAAGAAPGQLF